MIVYKTKLKDLPPTCEFCFFMTPQREDWWHNMEHSRETITKNNICVGTFKPEKKVVIDGKRPEWCPLEEIFYSDR